MHEEDLQRTMETCFTRTVCAALLAACAACLAGCATLPDGHAWGEDVTLTPRGSRLRHALAGAASAPETWAPVALALALQVDGMDERLSTWAADETLIFGSGSGAGRASDRLVQVTSYTYLISLLASPSGEDARSWTVNKLKGGALGYTTIGATHGAVELLKRATDRTRPDGSDDRSFPSGHAAGSAVRATLASRNARAIFHSPALRTASGVTCALLAGTCAWARVEAGKHYPSDVLAGLAFGHFLGAFVNDAFIEAGAPEQVGVSFVPSRGGFAVAIEWSPR